MTEHLEDGLEFFMFARRGRRFKIESFFDLLTPVSCPHVRRLARQGGVRPMPPIRFRTFEVAAERLVLELAREVVKH